MNERGDVGPISIPELKTSLLRLSVPARLGLAAGLALLAWVAVALSLS
jgi:hypothetical protein